MICYARLYPLDIRPEEVPCFVEENRRKMRVDLAHPSNDPQHPNVLASKARYERRRFLVTIVPAEVIASPPAPPRRRAA